MSEKMTEMQTLEATPDGLAVPGLSKPRQRRTAVMLVVFALVGAVLVPANAWFRGGTHLAMPGGFSYRIPALAVGQSVSFGVPMETSGGPSVVVKSADSEHGSNVSVRFSILHTEPGAPGVGFQYDAVRGTTPITPAGVRVAAPAPPRTQTTCTTGGPNTPSRCTPASGPDLGATWLVVTVTRLKPGPWSVSRITVQYSSWLRNRTTTSSMTADSRTPQL